MKYAVAIFVLALFLAAGFYGGTVYQARLDGIVNGRLLADYRAIIDRVNSELGMHRATDIAVGNSLGESEKTIGGGLELVARERDRNRKNIGLARIALEAVRGIRAAKELLENGGGGEWSGNAGVREPFDLWRQ